MKTVACLFTRTLGEVCFQFADACELLPKRCKKASEWNAIMLHRGLVGGSWGVCVAICIAIYTTSLCRIPCSCSYWAIWRRETSRAPEMQNRLGRPVLFAWDVIGVSAGLVLLASFVIYKRNKSGIWIKMKKQIVFFKSSLRTELYVGHDCCEERGSSAILFPQIKVPIGTDCYQQKKINL